MSNKLRIALLGAEHPHCDFWQPVFRDAEHTELTGIWSRTAGLDAQKAAQYACRHWSDRDALIEASDAVAICASTVEHAELIEAAAVRGKKILCEKPIADSLDACQRIETVVEQTGAYYMQGFPKRFDPINHKIKALLDNGAIGTVNLVRIRHGHPYAALGPAFCTTWFADPAQAGGGALLDEGVHGADLLHWLFGVPSKVNCTISTHTAGLAVEDVAVAVFHYPNGMIGEITSSWLFLAADNSVEIYGSDGSIILTGVDLGSRDLTHGAYLKHYRRPADHPLTPQTLSERRWTIAEEVPQFKRATPDFHANVARAFIECASRNTPPPVTLQDGLVATRMILSAYQAAASAAVESIVI